MSGKEIQRHWESYARDNGFKEGTNAYYVARHAFFIAFARGAGVPYSTIAGH